jgi:Protein of unknown function (DUF1592)/Protein of unknown function (DUF1588)/Protein of unknown function (DUF1587)/Protein of unknown function (DUF1585)/Protein of unknown function (DUF1595)/Ca-dependent carbohydrate-binding module xylan-binding
MIVFSRLAVVIFITVVSGLTGNGWAIDLATREQEYQKQILPLLERTCIDCHSGGEPAGGMALNHFPTAKSILKERKTWEKIIQRVDIGDMPPMDADPLSPEDRKKLTEWLRSMITDVDCGRTPNPGSVTLRRLNRNEYRNTIRDLLGIDYAPASDFPGDDVGYGFDNIGDVLTLPPILMEKYLAAAEEITAQAISAPEPGQLFETSMSGEQLSFKQGVSKGNGRLTFFAHGFAEFSEQAPWAGAYTLELNLSASKAGDDPARMAVFVDDKKIRDIAVVAEVENPKVYSVPLRLRSGKRTIKIEFINDFYIEAKGSSPAQDRNAYLFNVRLTGRKPTAPLAEESLPESHKKLIIAQPTLTVTAEEAFRKVLQPLASRAFRRPATKAELDRIVQLATKAHEEGESYEGSIRLAIQAIIISPHFLFKVEQVPQEIKAGEYPKISQFELATRISYFLWSTMPDDRLLQLAMKKELDNPEVIRREVKRMIQDKRANEFVENFAGQWLTLRRLDLFQPNSQLFPSWNDRIRELARRETFTFFAGVMRDDTSILTLLDGDFTYLNEELAQFYGITGVKGKEFRKVSLVGQPRMGLLTQASILAVTSNPTRTSPVKRGKWILDNVLGTPPPNPPPGVPELEKGKLTGTLREQIEQHRANPACASCHRLMDPLGLALENFDAVGLWRTQDAGTKIDASGVLPDGSNVKHAGDLIRTLRTKNPEQFARCLTEKMLCFALGRGLEYYDRCTVDKILIKLKADDYRFSTLVTEILSSDAFQRHGEREAL